jgi:hypothetical protein
MENAKTKIIAYRRKQFLELELPILFKNMDLLGMTINDLNAKYELYTKSLV